MRRLIAGLLLLVFLLPNVTRSDVRIDERASDAIALMPTPLDIPDVVASSIALPDKTPPLVFLFPADGVITSGFGWRRDPLDGRRRFHAGIDIANLRSSVVRAAAAGRVRRAGAMGSCGRAVEIVHAGGVVSRSCHLQRALVAPGDGVALHEPIGLMGASGRATGNHLHFELRRAGRPIDPTSFLMF